MSGNWETACGKALPKSERVFLKTMAASAEQLFGNPTIVNIGVFRCASMYCLRAGSAAGRIVGVDIEKCTVPIRKDLRAEFIIGDSRDVAPVFKAPIHMLFIDGDHRYKGVKADLLNWVPKIAIKGVLVLHDCYPKPKAIKAHPAIKGVNKAVTEWYDVNAGRWLEILGAPESLRAFVRLR